MTEILLVKYCIDRDITGRLLYLQRYYWQYCIDKDVTGNIVLTKMLLAILFFFEIVEILLVILCFFEIFVTRDIIDHIVLL